MACCRKTRATAALLFVMAASSACAQPQATQPLAENASAKLIPADVRVRNEFLHAWNAYKQYAWGHDDLRPLSKSFRDWHAQPLLMTAVDSLSTMMLMGLDEEAKRTREYITAYLSFDHDISVKNFEITIRILGGLLSAHQMGGDPKLLALADDLGRRLLPAFNSPTGMPYMFVNLKTGATSGAVSNPAEIGTLIVEFGTLSKLTGKPVYFEKAKRALVELFKRRSAIGLVGSTINVETGEWVNKRSHVSGGIDSYYEYLLKAAILFDDTECAQMYRESIAAVNKYLADETTEGLWYGQADMQTGARTGTRFGALDAFLPAVLALGGDIERARRLQESSFKMWQVAGIEPEGLDYSTMKIVSPGYILRPEIIESAYYLYFYTHDERYREMGRVFFDALVKHCRVEAGYASLRSVETKEKSDRMESFLLAETLKYVYLLFAPPAKLDLKKVVFNTEAHPIRKTW